MRKAFIGLCLISLAQLMACGGEEASTTNNSPERVESQEPAKAKMREVSELAMVMRDMHEVLGKAKPFAKSGEAIPDSLRYPYELILTAKKTAGMGEGPAYDGFAQIYLTSVDSLYAHPSMETYNGVVNACVSCHNSYCTGPLSKIKKLGIK